MSPILKCYLTAVLLAGVQTATADDPKSDDVKTLCELSSHAQAYNGSRIKVEGVLSWHPHGPTFIGGAQCPNERAIVRRLSNYTENPDAARFASEVHKNGGRAYVVYEGSFRVLDGITCSPVTFCSQYSIEVQRLVSARPY